MLKIKFFVQIQVKVNVVSWWKYYDLLRGKGELLGQMLFSYLVDSELDHSRLRESTRGNIDSEPYIARLIFCTRDVSLVTGRGQPPRVARFVSRLLFSPRSAWHCVEHNRITTIARWISTRARSANRYWQDKPRLPLVACHPPLKPSLCVTARRRGKVTRYRKTRNRWRRYRLSDVSRGCDFSVSRFHCLVDEALLVVGTIIKSFLDAILAVEIVIKSVGTRRCLLPQKCFL